MPTMRAIQVPQAKGRMELVERPIPEVAPGTVRIRVQACGVCHSDCLVQLGLYPGITYPRVPGHEVIGTIDAMATDVKGFRHGQRVGVGWHGGSCGYCGACLRGWSFACENIHAITGLTFDGGYADYLVAPASAVAQVPDGLQAKDAAPLMCAGITTFNALRNSGAGPGDTVAIQGLGGLGHLGVQFSAKMGFRTVAISRGADKEELARQLGAHEYIDTQKIPAAEGLKKLGGADVVLATAPNAEAIESTTDGLKPRGKLVIVAAPFEPLKISAMGLLSGKGIAGWPSGSSIDSEDAMNFSALTNVRPRVEVFKLEQAEQAFGKMIENRVRFRAVLTP